MYNEKKKNKKKRRQKRGETRTRAVHCILTIFDILCVFLFISYNVSHSNLTKD